MQYVSRRSVLQSIAKVTALAAAGPLFSTLQGCCPCNDHSLTLNVVLHGLFVLHFTDTQIELLTPYVHDHIYRAGNWDMKEVFPLCKEEYSLRGITSNPSAPVITSNCNLDFSQDKYKFKLRSERSFFKVSLPFPDDLKLLRCSPDPVLYTQNPPACRAPQADETPVYKLSLCQVLVYRVEDYRKLALQGTSWKPKVDRKFCTANLHFWAEPPDRLSPCHADDAYQNLDDLLDTLHLRLKFYSTVPLDIDTKVKGFPPEQEQGWSDWASGGGEGAYPTNCCAVMVRK
jgi:hypothetical protein